MRARRLHAIRHHPRKSFTLVPPSDGRDSQHRHLFLVMSLGSPTSPTSSPFLRPVFSSRDGGWSANHAPLARDPPRRHRPSFAGSGPKAKRNGTSRKSVTASSEPPKPRADGADDRQIQQPAPSASLANRVIFRSRRRDTK